MNAIGTVQLFDLEPGDGQRYRVLFGRVEVEQSLFQGYTIFGVAEGHDHGVEASQLIGKGNGPAEMEGSK